MMKDPEIAELLKNAKTIAVVGLSSNPARASFGVARFLQRQGFRIIPVNPNETEVLGEKAYGALSAVPDEVDIADVFRRPDQVDAVVDDAIKAGIRYLWLQEGIVNHEAAKRAEQNGISVVMDRCILKELARLFTQR
jgi:predicted CoA-binding protein